MFNINRRARDNRDDRQEDEDGILVRKIETLEELVSRRTRGLQEATDRLNQLSKKDDKPEADTQVKAEESAEELFKKPHGPKEELVIEPEGEQDNSDEPGEDTGPEKAEFTLEPAETPVAEKPGDDSSINNLFSDEEEEENPLAGLIASLPDVTASELLNEVREVGALVRDRRRR